MGWLPLETQRATAGSPLLPASAHGARLLLLSPDNTSRRLDSWKEIAAYLKRDVTTVRRWEKREGLPVHRHLHEQRDSVYAFTAEIDVWWQGRRNHLADNGARNGEPRPPDTYARAVWMVATIACLALVLVMVGVRAGRVASRDENELRFSILPPDHASFGTVALSPDGRQLAFTAAIGGTQPMLWLRPLHSLTPQPLPGTEGATFPFWSPDSVSIGFFAHGSLMRIGVGGGAPRVVCDAPDGRGGTWNDDGVIVFSPSRVSALLRVSAAGGTATPVTTVARPGERGHLWPEFLPDGNHFLYLADSSEPEFHNLFVGALDKGERKPLFRLASNAMFAPSGYLLFARDRQLIAQPFDPRSLQTTGQPVTLDAAVLQQSELDHKGDFSVSRNNVLMYRGIRGVETQVVWRDRDGRPPDVLLAAAEYYEPTLSPDGRHIAVDVFDPRPSKQFGLGISSVTSDIWLLDTISGTRSRFTFDPSADFDPVWSPDGTRIVFTSNRRGAPDLYLKNVNSAGSDELLLESATAKHAQAWSPDGRYLVYTTFNKQTLEDLWLLPMTGERKPVPLLQGEFSEEQPQISPDGRWFAYTSNESGRPEVYVQRLPDARQQEADFDWRRRRCQVAPRWRRTLLHRSGPSVDGGNDQDRCDLSTGRGPAAFRYRHDAILGRRPEPLRRRPRRATVSAHEAHRRRPLLSLHHGRQLDSRPAEVTAGARLSQVDDLVVG